MKNQELSDFLSDNFNTFNDFKNDNTDKAFCKKKELMSNEIEKIKESREWLKLKDLLEQINKDKRQANLLASKLNIKLNGLSFGHNSTSFFLGDSNKIKKQAEKEYKRIVREEKSKDIARIIKAYELLNN